MSQWSCDLGGRKVAGRPAMHGRTVLIFNLADWCTDLGHSAPSSLSDRASRSPWSGLRDCRVNFLAASPFPPPPLGASTRNVHRAAAPSRTEAEIADPCSCGPSQGGPQAPPGTASQKDAGRRTHAARLRDRPHRLSVLARGLSTFHRGALPGHYLFFDADLLATTVE